MEGRREEEILRVIPAVLLRLLAVALLLTSCITSTDIGVSPAPSKTPDAVGGVIAGATACRTSYISRARQVSRSRQEASSGGGAQVPSGGVNVFGPDSNGMQVKILSGGIAYVTFRQWSITGTYNVVNALRAALDAAVAAGAKAWLFDLRGNPGGNGADAASSFFLNGEPTLKTLVK